MSSRFLAVAPLVVAFTAAPALAQEHVQPDPQHAVSFTISPLHLLAPIVELQAEFRLNPKLGLAGILGIGSISITEDGRLGIFSDGDETFDFFTFELGAKIAYYAVGDFEEGMQLGLEVLYAYVATDDDDPSFEGAAGFGSGFMISPFIGYKVIADVGFTFEAQLGPALSFARAENDEGETATETRFGANLNLNIGWSF